MLRFPGRNMHMDEEQMSNCEMCGKPVPKSDLSRDKECGACRAEDRASDMTVGDLGGR